MISIFPLITLIHTGQRMSVLHKPLGNSLKIHLTFCMPQLTGQN